MHEPLGKFFRDRGPHVAAMIAYFALLSLVPLVFLALALLSVAGRADESSYLVRELQNVFPSRSFGQIVTAVHEVRKNAATLGRDRSRAAAAGRRCRCSPCSSRRSTSSTGGRTARSSAARRCPRCCSSGSLIALFLGLVVGTFGVPPAHAPRRRRDRQRDRRVRAHDPRLVLLGARVPAGDLRAADERAAADPRRPAGRAARDGAAPGELPVAADLPAARRTR